MKNRFLLWAAKGVGIFIVQAIKDQIVPLVQDKVMPVVREELLPVVREAAKEAIAAEIRSQIQKQS